MRTDYVPVMLQPGWILERYYGWTVLEQEPELKLLARRRGPVTTHLLMVRGAAEERLEQAAARHGLLGPLSITVLADLLDRSTEGERALLGKRLERVERRRWFGAGTLVFDLGEDEPALFARMAARERGKCRGAERAGVHVEIHAAPDEALLRRFLQLHGRMARERGLEVVEPAVLRRMFAAGDALLSHCRDAEGRSLVANVTYRAHGQGYFLHGAREREIPSGAGQLAQWETVRRLKRDGLAFYDLGLLASRDAAADGIYRFKKSLGAELVDLGCEYRWVPRALRAAYAAFRGLRGRLRRR